MADEIKQAEKKPEAQDESVAIFIAGSQGFYAGYRTWKSGEEIRWEKPEGWKDEKYGKHFSDFGPSLTFQPKNEKAKAVLAAHKAKITAMNQPQPSGAEQLLAALKASDERAQKAQEQNQQTLDLLAKLVAKLADKK